MVSYSLLQGLGNIAQESSTNQTAEALVENQLWPPLDKVSVSQEREVHRPNTKLSTRIIRCSLLDRKIIKCKKVLRVHITFPGFCFVGIEKWSTELWTSIGTFGAFFLPRCDVYYT